MADGRGADEFYPAVWNGFIRLKTVSNHWTRHPEWDTQASQYSWFIPINDPRFLSAAGRANVILTDSGPVEEVLDDELHLTMFSVAPSGRVRPGQIDELVAKAQSAVSQISRFDLELGPLNGLSESIIAEVRPWDDIRALHQCLYELTVETLGKELVRASSELFPHVAISYVTRDAPAHGLISAVAGMRNARVLGTQPVDGIELVELSRSGPHYRFNTVGQVDLAEQRDILPSVTGIEGHGYETGY